MGYSERVKYNYSDSGIHLEMAMITDGGMEVWTSATNLTNWLETVSGTSTVNREATEKIEGAYSCRLDVDASNNHVVLSQRDIPLVPLRRYKLVIWYKNSVAGKTACLAFRNKASGVWLKEDGTWTAVDTEIVIPNSTVWKKYELEFSAHADYSLYYIWLYEDAATSSSIYFDDASIVIPDMNVATFITPRRRHGSILF